VDAAVSATLKGTGATKGCTGGGNSAGDVEASSGKIGGLTSTRSGATGDIILFASTKTARRCIQLDFGEIELLKKRFHYGFAAKLETFSNYSTIVRIR
jgi:hypothetical protein